MRLRTKLQSPACATTARATTAASLASAAHPGRPGARACNMAAAGARLQQRREAGRLQARIAAVRAVQAQRRAREHEAQDEPAREHVAEQRAPGRASAPALRAALHHRLAPARQHALDRLLRPPRCGSSRSLSKRRPPSPPRPSTQARSLPRPARGIAPGPAVHAAPELRGCVACGALPACAASGAGCGAKQARPRIRQGAGVQR